MRFVAFLILFLYAVQSYTQEPAHYIIGKDIFDGVHLYSIIQDDTDNSMWISSNKGIYNYNGISFTHQTPKKSKSSALFGLTKDNKGTIFCFNLNGQVFKLYNKKFELYYTITNPKAKSIFNIVFDNKNNLFIASQKGYFTVLSETKKNIVYSGNNNFPVKHNDTLFYFNENKDLEKKTLIKRYDNKEVIVTSYKDSYKIFFVKNKLYSYDYYTNKIYKLKNGSTSLVNNLNFLSNKSQGKIINIGSNLWFCSTAKGVYLIPKNNFEKHKKHNELFKKYVISGGLEDNEGNIWLLTFNKGIINIPNLKNTITKAPDNSSFKAITKTENQLYIATENGQIYKLNQQTLLPFFTLDKNDRVEHLKVFPKQKYIVSSEKIYANNTSKKISFCRDAVLLKDSLIVGSSHALGSYNLQENQQRWLSSGRIYDIFYDTITKKIWFTTNAGLKQYKNGKTTNITYNGKEILKAKTLTVNNQVWVASKNGIYIFKNDSSVKHITEKDGLLTNDIDNIKFEHPNVYLVTKKGMQRYNINTKTFSNFTFADGLTKSVTQFEVLNDTVYAINSDGLLRFTFKEKNNKKPTYKTHITKAIANGTTLIKNNSTLEANENNVNFSFLTPTFKYQKEIRYQYQLIGVDKKPIKALENQLSVNYGNIPAGNYTFKVVSFLRNTENKTATLNFTIKQTWYKSLWFRSLILGLFTLLLYFIYKTQLNKVLRKRDKQELQKRLAESSLTSLKAQMNPHFLFNAMNSIQALILNDKKEEAYQYLTQLSNLVRENLKMSDVSFVNFSDELKLIKKYLQLEQLRFKNTFTYTIENNIKNDDVLIPSMIIQPFIENAIKHGLLHRKTNRKLTVEFQQQQTIIKCIITDNGIGRKASQEIQKKRKYKSFSTNAIKKRFDILKEYYNIDVGFSYNDLHENNIATGTQVTIKIPFSDEFES